MNEYPEVRVPPQSLEAEQAVLGAMILDRYACETALRMLKSEDFYREAHRRIFESIRELIGLGEPVDMLTLTNELKQAGNLERVGGITGLAELVERVPTAANVDYYAKIVREKSVSRTLISMATRIVGDAYSDSKPVQELLREIHRLAEKTLEDASTFREYEDSMVQVVAMVRKKLQDNWEGNADWYIPTGFPRFDSLIGGFEKKKLILFTGDPGIGKSALLQQMAIQIAQKNIPIGYVCLDVDTEEIPLRMACNKVNVDYRDLGSRDPQVMSKSRQLLVHQSLDDIECLSTLYLVGQEHIGFNFDAFEDWARLRVRQSGMKAIIIDSAAKLDLQEVNHEKTESAMARMVNRLKFLGSELNVPMVTIHETNQGESKTPKHSGAWMFVARYWFHLTRDEQDGHLINMIVRKNSNGRRDLDLMFRQVGQFRLKEVEPENAKPVSSETWEERS